MSQPKSHPRSLNHNNFGNNATINQGDIHYNVTPGPLLPGVDKPTYIIPYPRNEDVIRREDLVDQLDQLLPRGSKFHSAALWGLGGSG